MNIPGLGMKKLDYFIYLFFYLFYRLKEIGGGNLFKTIFVFNRPEISVFAVKSGCA